MERTPPKTLAQWNAHGAEYLPGHLGLEVLEVAPERVRLRMPVGRRLCAPNGYLHAGAVVSLADTACGYGTIANLPADAAGFTTIELKSNFLGTALEGAVVAVATPVHRGRGTQVWDATVSAEKTGKAIAVFRCTQMILRTA